MEVWILRGTDPETLEEKINKQLEEVEKVMLLSGIYEIMPRI